MSDAEEGPAASSAVRAGALAIVDQALFVGASTLLVFLLGRALPPAEYGGFVLAYSTFLLLAQVQTALFAEPMSVFAPSRYADEAPAYVRAVVKLHRRGAWLAALALLAVAGVLAVTGSTAPARAFLGVGLATPGLLELWLRRRVLYLEGRVARSTTTSAVLLVAGTGGVLGMGALGALSAETGLIVLGAAAWIAIAASGRPADANAPEPGDVLHAHWSYGRWALLSALLGWCGNAYYFLLPIRHGLEGTAALRALLNFVYPVVQANQAITLAMLPRWAAREDVGAPVRSLAWLWVAISLALVAAAWFAGPFALHHVYGGRYDGSAALLPLVFLLVLPDGLTSILANGLRARRAPRRVAEAAIALPVVALLPGLPLTWYAGPSGAVWALLLASAAQLAWIVRGWRRPGADQD